MTVQIYAWLGGIAGFLIALAVFSLALKRIRRTTPAEGEKKGFSPPLIMGWIATSIAGGLIAFLLTDYILRENQIAKILRAAGERRDDGRWTQAIEKAREALAVNPDREATRKFIEDVENRMIQYELLIQKLDKAQTAERWAEAEAAAKKILELVPSHPKAKNFVPLRVFRPEHGTFHSVAFSPDGKLLAAGGIDIITFWNPATWKESFGTITGRFTALSAAFSNDGSMFATGDDDGTLSVWHMSNRKLLWKTDPLSAPITEIRFAKDGKQLTATCDRPDDGHPPKYYTMDLSNGQGLYSGFAFSRAVIIGWSGGGAAADPNTNAITITELGANPPQWPIGSHCHTIASLVFSSDEKILASGGRCGVVKLWSMDRKVELRSYYGHTGTVGSMTFSPDGKTLATASEDGSVRIWDMR